MAPSIALEEAAETIEMAVRAKLWRLRGIGKVVARIGRPEAGSHPHPVNFAEVHVEPEDGEDKADHGGNP